MDRFNITNAKPICTPLADHFRSSSAMCPKTQEEEKQIKGVPYSLVVGSLMYAMVCTHLDIAHAMGVVRKFMSNPNKTHWQVIQWILRYLKGRFGHVLCFGGNDTQLQDYVDLDMAGDLDKHRSTTGYVFTFVRATISWAS